MNLRAVSRVLGGFVAFFTLAQLAPLLLALVESAQTRASPANGAAVAGFGVSMGVGALAATLLWTLGRSVRTGFHWRDTLCVAGVAWLVAGVLGALPFVRSGLLPRFADALFESVSGLTTCGGTVLGSAGNPTPEQAPGSLLLWRAELQWLGGIGIVLIFVALLPPGSASKNLLMAESVGVSNERYRPRLLEQARWVVGVYCLLTLACALLLLAVGGMGWLDAACHAMSCLATGGYSTKTSLAVFDHVGAEVVLTVFMYVGGCSFTVMAGVLRDGGSGLRTLLQSGEFRLYTLCTVAAVGCVAVDLMRGGLVWHAALRQASFNVVSMLSCCGFATADFHAWPPLSLLVIFTCTMVGGCSGSAAGGMKQVRVLVCLRLLGSTLRGFVQPRRVDRLRLDNEVVSPSTVTSILAMVLLWQLTVAAGAMVIACDQRLSFVGALTASASMLGNCGPALAAVDPSVLADGLPALGQGVAVIGPNIGPLGGYGDLAGWTKLAMCFEMVLGRLELLPLLALASPAFWRR